MTQTLTIKRHAALVDRMAETLGIDLEEATLQGFVLPDTLTDAVLRCTGCSNPDGCTQWLQSHSAGAEATPSMCRNGDLFAMLRDGKRV
ncbi:DUF6455 family protein [Roseovarius aestuariivivens]|uniref:DUF6455 family protein n=1 Tax=Roseovarius aestuariivivens TaxID=1888910 RepID=UPI001081A7E8|nr:DUF6455 family protein [Roseovarius aestuariivivens]